MEESDPSPPSCWASQKSPTLSGTLKGDQLRARDWTDLPRPVVVVERGSCWQVSSPRCLLRTDDC